MYLKLEDKKTGKNTMLKEPCASKQKVVPIEKVEKNIKINESS